VKNSKNSGPNSSSSARFRFEPSRRAGRSNRLPEQKVSTLQARDRISKDFAVRREQPFGVRAQDSKGRTEQLLCVMGAPIGRSEVVQAGDLRLKLSPDRAGARGPSATSSAQPGSR